MSSHRGFHIQPDNKTLAKCVRAAIGQYGNKARTVARAFSNVATFAR